MCVDRLAAPGPPIRVSCADIGLGGGRAVLLSCSSLSATFDSLFDLCDGPGTARLLAAVSTLEYRLPLGGVGDVTLGCGSTLDDLFIMLFGNGGTGGTSESLGLGDVTPFKRPGDVGLGEATLNVRSVIEPLLPVRCKPGRGPLFDMMTLPLAFEDVEPRLTIRLVCRLDMGSGDVVCDRSAAAAAAEEREVIDPDL